MEFEMWWWFGVALSREELKGSYEILQSTKETNQTDHTRQWEARLSHPSRESRDSPAVFENLSMIKLMETQQKLKHLCNIYSFLLQVIRTQQACHFISSACNNQRLKPNGYQKKSDGSSEEGSWCIVHECLKDANILSRSEACFPSRPLDEITMVYSMQRQVE